MLFFSYSLKEALSQAFFMVPARIDLTEARKLFIYNQLQTQQVTHSKLLEVFQKVPREFFLNPINAHHAYLDAEIPTPSKRATLSSKKIAKLFAACDFQHRPKILIIGFSMGYSLAIAYELGAKIYGIEEDSLLYSYAQTSLQHYFDTYYGRTNLDDCIFFEQRAHHEGLAEQGPYDIILIEGGVEKIPDSLLTQLRPQGKIVYISKNNPKGIVQLARNHSINLIGFESAFTVPGFESKLTFEF